MRLSLLDLELSLLRITCACLLLPHQATLDSDTTVAVESLLQISGAYSPSVSSAGSASSPGAVVSPPPSPTESLCTDTEDERLQATNKVRTHLLWGGVPQDY